MESEEIDVLKRLGEVNFASIKPGNEVILYEGPYTDEEIIEMLSKIRSELVILEAKNLICYPRIEPKMAFSRFYWVCGCLPFVQFDDCIQIICVGVSRDELKRIYDEQMKVILLSTSISFVDVPLIEDLESPHLAMGYYHIFKEFQGREGVRLNIDTPAEGQYMLSLSNYEKKCYFGPFSDPFLKK